VRSCSSLTNSKINIKRAKKVLNFFVEVVEHDFVQARWSEIEALVRQEFQDSNFNDRKFD